MTRVLAVAAFVLIAVSGTACRPDAEQRTLEARAMELLDDAGYNPIDVTVDWPEDGVVTVVLGGSPDPSAVAEVLWEELPPGDATLRIWVGRSMTEFTGDSLMDRSGVRR